VHVLSLLKNIRQGAKSKHSPLTNVLAYCSKEVGDKEKKFYSSDIQNDLKK
jgi:hypothetical protein